MFTYFDKTVYIKKFDYMSTIKFGKISVFYNKYTMNMDGVFTYKLVYIYTTIPKKKIDREIFTALPYNTFNWKYVRN